MVSETFFWSHMITISFDWTKQLMLSVRIQRLSMEWVSMLILVLSMLWNNSENKLRIKTIGWQSSRLKSEIRRLLGIQCFTFWIPSFFPLRIITLDRWVVTLFYLQGSSVWNVIVWRERPTHPGAFTESSCLRFSHKFLLTCLILSPSFTQVILWNTALDQGFGPRLPSVSSIFESSPTVNNAEIWPLVSNLSSFLPLPGILRQLCSITPNHSKFSFILSSSPHSIFILSSNFILDFILRFNLSKNFSRFPNFKFQLDIWSKTMFAIPIFRIFLYFGSINQRWREKIRFDLGQ